MVGHQAIAQNAHAGFLRVMPQQGDVNNPVAVAKENILLMIAPLRDVMGAAGENDACCSSHVRGVGRCRVILYRNLPLRSLSPI
jgi:hypothetical protein